MSMHGVRTFTEPVFYRGRDGQESEEGKEDHEGSNQEGGKEELKEKEVVATRDRDIATSLSQPRTQSENLSKGSEVSFAAVRYRSKVRLDRAFVQMTAAQ
ncbi:hypothetical protein JJB99_32675 [Bradyrhizobium diazoefficiens]|uniref:hypothetical protein n=1 Tax=Bradyrhizobium diazoefficiens TaxID=1355477 RepID=UPI00190D424A|nr:hypothetical protein [Bradyrhizobium diazoefficiens]QQO14019.1 hypothetical protein JJB99_32675 [Bradyrhizobium diazoefficiens]